MPVILGGSKNIKLSHETGFFLARYEDAESAPKRTYKHTKISKFFKGRYPRTPVLKGEGWEGVVEGYGREGREGVG
jgi:hypothetical protein